MTLPTSGLLALLGVTAILLLTFVLRPSITGTKGGKILAFFALFLLPVLCLGVGTTYHIDRSKQTTFCLSCHEMEPYGKSLLVDDLCWWTICCISRRHIFRIIEFRWKRRATRATRTMQCLADSKRRCTG